MPPGEKERRRRERRMLAPLQVDDLALDELAIARGEPPRPGQRLPKKLEYIVAVNFDVTELPGSRNRPRSRVTLAVRLESRDPEAPCPVRLVHARVSGTFSFTSRVGKDVVGQLVPTNCLVMLYGALRGMVVQATGSCHGGCLILPALNIHEVVSRKAAGEDTSEVVRASLGRPRIASIRTRPRSRPTPGPKKAT
jgi:hypothetical protein